MMSKHDSSPSRSPESSPLPLPLPKASNIQDSKATSSQPLLSFGHQQRASSSLLKRYGLPMLAVTNGALYFFVAAAGVNNIENFLGLEGSSAGDGIAYTLSGTSSVIYAAFFLVSLENFKWPENRKLYGLIPLAMIASNSFYAAGKEGADSLSIPSAAGHTLGAALLAFRSISVWDGLMKFPDRVNLIGNEFKQAISSRGIAQVLRLLLTLYATVGYSLSITDGIFAATQVQACWWFDICDGITLDVFSYIFAVLGASLTMPLVLLFIHKGVKQLTYGGGDEITDKYTFIASVPTVAMVLGILGSATEATGQMFGRVGDASRVIRVSSSVIYAVCGSIPGLAPRFRNLLQSSTPIDSDHRSGAEAYDAISISDEERVVSTPSCFSRVFGFFRSCCGSRPKGNEAEMIVAPRKLSLSQNDEDAE